MITGTANNGRTGVGTCPVLEEAFLQQGFELGNLDDSQILVSLNHNASASRKFRNNGQSNKSFFLIALEPKSVYPAQYSQRILNLYDHCFFPGNIERQQTSSGILGWPYLFNQNPASPKSSETLLSDHLNLMFQNQIFDLKNWIQRKSSLTMVAANKVSPTNENLYGLRRGIASLLGPEELKLYGPLWSSSLIEQAKHRLGVLAFSLKSYHFPNLISIFGALGRQYPCALGPVEDKHSILRDSKFSLVIENSSENITEKLFDAMINGAIPIYIGPNLQKSGIPDGVAIQGLSDAKSISRRIHTISEEEVSQHLLAISEFLQSPDFLNVWDNYSAFNKVANEISLRIRAQG